MEVIRPALAGQDGFFFLFSWMNFICIDGEMTAAGNTVFRHDNRSFRYGDGLFVTMKMIRGEIRLKKFHFERLFNSLRLLHYTVPPSFTESHIESLVNELAVKNNCHLLCRVRLTIYRGNGMLYPVPEELNYVIECTPLKETVNLFNEEGLTIDVFSDARKSNDLFSAIKSANFLPYVMGAVYAGKNKLDDCVLLNVNGNIADTTIANIFVARKKNISTPALTEGCINGVMRRYLLEQFHQHGYACTEAIISEEELRRADEVFLTNSINGIRWVKKLGNKQYNNTLARNVYKEFIAPIFA